MAATRFPRAAFIFLAVALRTAPLVRAEGPASTATAPIVVRIYHTNDIHGYILPRPDKLQNDRLVGGAAALKALLNRDSGPKLVLDAGDWWQGTPEGSLTKGAAVAEVFNAIGYDAIELGNHEFDAGQDELKSLIGKMAMPVLAANVYGADGKRVPWTKPSIVKEVAGIKFGIFGLVTSHLDHLVLPSDVAGLTIRREVDEARDQVKALRRQGVDVVVAVTHVGFEAEGLPKFEGDQTLAREVEGIDLIVGGHTHTTLVRPYRDPAHGTMIVQAGSYLVRVGRATLKFDPKTRRLLSEDDELIELRPDRIGEDPAVKAVVAKQTEALSRIFDVVVATAPMELSRGDGSQETGLGSWMADCYRSWSGTDVAFQNGGGLRVDVASGPVTLRALFNVMPFDDGMVKLRMTGAQLRDFVDRGVGARRLIQISGMTAEFDRSKPAGERLGALTVGGAALDPGKTYTVALQDFLLSDVDGGVEREEAGVLARDVIKECAQKQGSIVAPAPGRLKPRGN
jgi:5'-nucleotidase/UDP-sugar diphosphatase